MLLIVFSSARSRELRVAARSDSAVVWPPSRMLAAWTGFAASGTPASSAVPWPLYDAHTDEAYVWAAPSDSTVSGLRGFFCDLFDSIGYNF